MNIRFRHVLMEGEPGAAGGGAAPTPAPAAPPASAPAAAPAGAPAEQGGATGSALSGGNEWTIESIPEKFRVKGADDQLDLTATIRKVDEHRASLEKRMGAGDIRPKTADEYKLPDTDIFKGLKLDEAGAKAFRQEAHDMGLSQKQYEAVMGKWATLAPELVSAAHTDTVDTAVAALKDAWKGDYEANIKASFSAAMKVGQAAGFTAEEVDAAIGNNPVAIRMFAALSKEMREDATPAAANGGTGGGAETREQYVAKNWAAYSNPQHAEHKIVTERAAAMADRESKGQRVAA